MKLAVVGAGSTYTPEVIDGLVRLRDLLAVDEVALVDPAEERLQVVAGLARRMLDRAGHPARLTTTARLDEAVEGADVVLVQIRVGGQTARMVDESLPVPCGCLGQETTGFGGLAKALRTVPVVLGIADRVRELAPGAWIVDFTNPVGIVTKALLDAGHRAVGLCSAAMVFQRHFANVLDVAPALRPYASGFLAPRAGASVRRPGRGARAALDPGGRRATGARRRSRGSHRRGRALARGSRPVALQGRGAATRARRAGGARAQLRKIDAAVDCPWVVLSSGVEPADFGAAVEAACRAGASGMLAGRAVWSGAAGRGATRARDRASTPDGHGGLGDRA